MVDVSTISGQIHKLNHEISNLEYQFKSKQNKFRVCGSDCYCRKEGNHKVTNSLYHKNCISMKKNIGSVKKSDLGHVRNRSSERKGVYHLGKAQVEISLKSCPKEVQDRQPKYDNCSEKPKKLVNTGTDPIAIVEPKRPLKKCWSSVLSENLKLDSPRGGSESNKIPFDPPEKLQAISSTSSSQSVGRAPVRRTVMVKDRGVQCDNGTGEKEFPDTNKYQPIYNPLTSLQTLIKDLKHFRRKLNENHEKSSLSSIISDMDFAIERLVQADPKVIERRTNGFSHQSAQKDGSASGTPRKTPLPGLENLQETCQQLQASCARLEQTCEKLHKEKDHVTQKFFEKSKEVEGCLKRELEYQARLNDAKQSADVMEKKLERYTKSMEDLSLHVTRLQAQNKALEQSEEIKNKLLGQLMEAAKENEKLNNEIQLMGLEREKNIVLLDLKEQELGKLKSELRSIGGLVSEKMLETVMAGDSLMMSSQLDLSESREVVFSSPDGTTQSPSKSWKAVSSILTTDLVRRPLRPTCNPHQPSHTGEVVKRNPLESIHQLKSELRDLFAEMKQQTSQVRKNEEEGVSELSRWSTLTDSSDGYNSITDNDLSNLT